MKGRRLFAPALALALLAGALYHGAELWRQQRLERDLAAIGQLAVDENTAPPLVFAKAWQLEQEGAENEAIRLYASLRDTPDLGLRARALRNLGTAYLRDAARRWNAHGVLEHAQVNTQVELAKENLREALRLAPEDWDARYNLEYAFRITPPPKEKAKADFQGSKSSVFSTLPGLPGGGP